MKHHINHKILFASLGLIGLTITSCDNDDIVYASDIQDITLSGNTNDIVLSEDAQDALVLTLHWNENGDISTSDPDIAAPNGAVNNTIEFSNDISFEKIANVNVDNGVYSYQFTCSALNALLSQLGYEGGVKAPLYVRIKGALGVNTNPFYSEVLELSVTPFKVDMTLGVYLNASKEDTGRVLRAPNEDKIYSGFIGAGAWENWWLRESDGHVWGNDGETGTPFVISSKDTAWNFWYPGLSGCYYTVVNIPVNEWSALLIPTMTLGGDIAGEMTYERKLNKWTYTFDAATAGTYNVTLTSTGKQYNVSTGTDDALAIDTPISFGGSAASLEFGGNGTIAVEIAQAGETTITLDLNDPLALKLTAEAGAAAPVEQALPYLYVVGAYGDWTFDWTIKLYNEDYLNYGAVLPVNSEWGYQIIKEENVWDDYYGMAAGGNGYEGQLVANGSENIAAPDPGLYLFDISLSALTYKLTAVTKVSYTGLNDDWSLTEMTASDEPCVYTAQVTKSANTPWGVKIVLNDNWDLFFGGNGKPGELVLFHDGFEGDNELENGVYTLTVDLAKGTYSYSK